LFPVLYTRKLSRLPNQTSICPKNREHLRLESGGTAAYGENMHAPREEILLMLLPLSFIRLAMCALFYDRALFFY
jgi:hypothetical protein